MPFDFKKEPLYRASQRPQIVQVPPCSYLAVGRAIPTSRREAISRLFRSFTPWPTH